MNADGKQRRLTRITGSNFVPFASPSWSPDGKRIIFVRNGQVWVANAAGSGQRRLTLEGAPFNPRGLPTGGGSRSSGAADDSALTTGPDRRATRCTS